MRGSGALRFLTVFPYRGALSINTPRGQTCLPAIGIPLLEIADLALRLVAFYAIAFLNPAEKLVALAFRGRQVIVRQLAPLLLDLAFELLPIPARLIGIHRALLVPVTRSWSRYKQQA